MGNKDLAKDIFIPLNICFEGMGLKVDQVSRNFNEGIKAGQTASITRNINGPWVGNISFYTDIVGEYNLDVVIDKNNELIEGEKKNNSLSKKIGFALPPNMNAYALERAIRSYASVAPADTLVSILRKSQAMDERGKNSIVKAISEGWDYKKKNVKLKPADKLFLTVLNKKLK